jgi:hypothetical protein
LQSIHPLFLLNQKLTHFSIAAYQANLACSLLVISFHRQGIAKLPEGLSVSLSEFRFDRQSMVRHGLE